MSASYRYSVLLVCLGNICRSPLAEGVIRDAVESEKSLNFSEWRIESRGTGGWHEGEHADERSIEVAKKHGIDIEKHRAKKLRKEDFHEFQYILCMDNSNYIDTLDVKPANSSAHILHYLANKQKVPDPYYGGIGGFEHVFQLLNNEAENWVSTIVKAVDSETNANANSEDENIECDENESDLSDNDETSAVSPISADSMKQALNTKK